ncbi:WxL domain-containing protein [Microtetraspora fusca]|uniref:WxL domain-containing protein n=1 Tax=Microtetraspora fusca TaxID=1997 RepID=A0ABW6VG42_MICFU
MSKANVSAFMVRTPLVLPSLVGLLLAVAAPASAAASASLPSSPAPWNDTVTLRADPLEITVPGTASLGSGPVGGSISASMGTVTVTDTRGGNPPWTVTVTATNFTTGAGTPSETISNGDIAYWSGPVTASSGTGTHTPGQLTAAQRVPLSSPVTAFSGHKTGEDTFSTSWDPTLVVTIPSTAATGVYTGIVTHSVS